MGPAPLPPPTSPIIQHISFNVQTISLTELVQIGLTYVGPLLSIVVNISLLEEIEFFWKDIFAQGSSQNVIALKE